MTDKKKIEVLRTELDKYKDLLRSAENENKTLSETVEKLTLQEERQKEFDGHNLQYEKMRAAFDKAATELKEYRAKYALLAMQLGEMRKHYRKEFEKVLVEMKNTTVIK